MSLYHKYEPKKFSEVIGQSFSVNILTTLAGNFQKAESLRINSIILSGAAGVGKTVLARLFAKAINCLNFQNDLCTNCICCEMNDSPDIIEIDAASYNSVEDIRKIVDDINYKPWKLKHKVYIMDETHMLSRSAFDALLISLQKLPPYIVFIFATTNLEKLPETFISRSLQLSINRLDRHELASFLKKIYDKESGLISLSKNFFLNIADFSNGSIRTSLSMMDLLFLVDINNEEIEKNDTEEFLLQQIKILSPTKCIDVVSSILEGDVKLALEKWHFLYKNGFNEKNFFHQIARLITDLHLAKLDILANKKIKDYMIHYELLEKYDISFKLLINFWEILITQMEFLYKGGELAVENMIIMFSLIEDSTDVLAVFKERLKNISQK